MPTLRVNDLVSYAVGCMFGRYSLDEPGLILADQGATLQDYLAKVPTPTFTPDADNVIPIVDGDWFEDDIVARFRQFLRAAFGEQHFEENLRFVTESLGVKDLRDYFVKSFYKDHVQRYKKRPIYWLFSSPKGSFNALIYMHRYTPSTVSTVLNEYLREFQAKLTSSLQQQERLAAGGGTPRQQAAAQKEADRLRKVLLELDEYEHDVLYPLASQQIAIDLDDGVKANYPKFGAALKKIPGLEASDERSRHRPAAPGAPLRRPPGRVLARPGGPVRRGPRQPRPAGRHRRSASPTTSSRSRTGCCTTSPTGKFLVYRSGQVPAGIGNWLLDLELAYGVFTADRTSLVAQDLGLTAEGIDEVVQAHEKFFNATKRVQSLKALLNPEDDAAKLRAKMQRGRARSERAQPAGDHPHAADRERQGAAHQVRRPRRLRPRRLLLARRRLDLRLRVAVAEHRRPRAVDLPQGDRRLQVRPPGRAPEHPARLREPAQRPAQPGGPRHPRQAGGPRPRLRGDDRGRQLPRPRGRRPLRGDRPEDHQRPGPRGGRADRHRPRGRRGRARTAEQRVDRRLPAALHGDRPAPRSCWPNWHRSTSRSQSFDEALERYRRDWFRIDQLYRQFTFAAPHRRVPEAAGGAARAGREALHQQVRLRAGQRLAAAGRRRSDQWRSSALRSQTSFYADYVEPLVRDGDKKAVVIISDALRYEVADELGSRIRQEDRFDADLDAVLGVLPSYTQLGMAALLPHSTLKHSPDAQDRARRRPADERHRLPQQDP